MWEISWQQQRAPLSTTIQFAVYFPTLWWLKQCKSKMLAHSLKLNQKIQLAQCQKQALTLTALTQCQHILKTEKFYGLTFRSNENGTFFTAVLKTVDFENRTLTSTFWKRHCVNAKKWWKQRNLRRFWNKTLRFLTCR